MREDHDAVLASLDVRDAFLTVLQEKPTLVHTTDASGGYFQANEMAHFFGTRPSLLF